MTLEHKFFPSGGREAKAAEVGDDGRISGYGAVFNNVDQGGDIIEPGAFAKSLASGKPIKMLWQHSPWDPIGVWDDVTEDDYGLRISGTVLSEVSTGADALALLKAGAIDGLSIGYRTIAAEAGVIDGQDVRVLKELELWEVSLVTFPMNTDAVVDAAKAAGMTIRDFERVLARDAKFSRSVIAALLRDGFEGVKALRESGGDDLDELRDALLLRSMINTLTGKGARA